jgi:nucleoporin-like protein 2
VRNDVQSEKPLWLLSCYSHAREGANDLTGDVSFEEVRWSTVQVGVCA